jgi:hypothetical protein
MGGIKGGGSGKFFCGVCCGEMSWIRGLVHCSSFASSFLVELLMIYPALVKDLVRPSFPFSWFSASRFGVVEALGFRSSLRRIVNFLRSTNARDLL